MSASPPPGALPLWLKLIATIWLALWVPIYWRAYGPPNFLWFCDLANFLIAAALWMESRLLFSSQAVSVLLVQIIWLLDVMGRLVLGFHPIGGTQFMFDVTTPLPLRLLSLFHVAMLALLIWGLRRMGYDRRGFALQLVIAAIVLPLSWLFGPERNINWTWGAFGGVQETLSPLLYLALLASGYLLILYLPSHWAFERWAAEPQSSRAASRRLT